jgi:hypothetical protein
VDTKSRVSNETFIIDNNKLELLGFTIGDKQNAAPGLDYYARTLLFARIHPPHRVNESKMQKNTQTNVHT